MPQTATTQEHGRAVAPDASLNAIAAREMLAAFASVGATALAVTLKNQRTGQTCFERGRPPPDVIHALPALLARAEREELDVIIRPTAPTTLLQLDDLSADSIERVKELAFLVIETSPDNFQAWLAVSDANEQTARQVKERSGADPHASGAVRLCGTRNRKPEHAPNFPVVRLRQVAPGRTTPTLRLAAAGLLASTAPATPEDTLLRTVLNPPARVPAARRFQSRTWPHYAECLAAVPSRNKGNETDVSRADWRYALIAADRGFSAEAIAARLLEVSEKAKREGARYAERTARRAVQSVANNKA